MKKTLEQLAEEERILERHNVYNAIQGSLVCAQHDLEPPRKSKADYDIAKYEIGHAYLLIGFVEHIEGVKMVQHRKIIDFYGKQLGYGKSIPRKQ